MFTLEINPKVLHSLVIICLHDPSADNEVRSSKINNQQFLNLRFSSPVHIFSVSNSWVKKWHMRLDIILTQFHCTLKSLLFLCL